MKTIIFTLKLFPVLGILLLTSLCYAMFIFVATMVAGIKAYFETKSIYDTIKYL